jgi:glutathione peroxidase
MSTRVRSLLAAAAVTAVAASSLTVMAHSAAPASFYDIETKALDGKPGNLAQYKGKVALVVNVASKCGYTPQYAGLEKLYASCSRRASSSSASRATTSAAGAGTAEEIATFCKTKYDVSFPLFEKGVTKAGPTQSPVYQFLGRSGNLPGWNFSKYVVDKKGNVVAFFPSKVTPDAPELKAAIDKALAE